MTAGAALSSCGPQTFATFSGVKGALPQAECQILGRTRLDQRWIDETTVVEVASFGMARPKPRAACQQQASRLPARAAPPPPAGSRPGAAPTPHEAPRPSGGGDLGAPGPAPHPAAAPKPRAKTLGEQVHDLNEKVKRLEGK